MKNRIKNQILFGLIIAVIALICSTFAQAQDAIPEKGDNTIIINNAQKADSNFILCSKILASKGYSFDSRDKDIGQIVTNPKSYAGAFNYKLIILCLDNVIKIKSSINMMTLAQTIVWVDWKYNNTPGDERRKSFKTFYPDIQQISNSISGKITFKKE